MLWLTSSKAATLGLLLTAWGICASCVSGLDVRVRDVATIEGERTNRLIGTGIVAGLANTGSKAGATREAFANLMQRHGQRLDPLLRNQLSTNTQIKTNNLSLVSVSTLMPVTARPGQTFDVSIQSLDDAQSLQGGFLIPTPLVGIDNEVYGMASGNVSIGGFSFGGDAASAVKNHPTSGRIPNGAQIERCTPIDPQDPGTMRLLLRSADWEIATQVTREINKISPGAATTEHSGAVFVQTPTTPDERAEFIVKINNLIVHPDPVAKIVINERTGTVIIGKNVRLTSVAIAHGNLSVVTAESPQVSQPAPFSDGETTVVPRTEIDVVEEKRPLSVVNESATVSDLVQALNALGVSPRDLSSIFQQLKEANAIQGQLEFN